MDSVPTNFSFPTLPSLWLYDLRLRSYGRSKNRYWHYGIKMQFENLNFWGVFLSKPYTVGQCSCYYIVDKNCIFQGKKSFWKSDLRRGGYDPYKTLLTLRRIVTDITLSLKVVHFAYLGSLEMFYIITYSNDELKLML